MIESTIETTKGAVKYSIQPIFGDMSILKVEVKKSLDIVPWQASYHLPFSHAEAMVSKFIANIL